MFLNTVLFGLVPSWHLLPARVITCNIHLTIKDVIRHAWDHWGWLSSLFLTHIILPRTVRKTLHSGCLKLV